MFKITDSGKQLNKYTIYFIAFIALIIRLLIMHLADETDPDAVSRVFTSWEWAKDPFWYKTSVWAPFHYYLTGSGFFIWKDIILLPKVLNILLSVAMIFPFYFFVKREFNKQGAVYASVFLVFSPLIFRLGFLSLAEIPGLLFLVLAMNLISKGVRENVSHFFILSGLSMTIASGFRYESWLLILLFTLMIFLGGRSKSGIIFFIFAMIFPVIWMIQNHLTSGDFLYSFHANTEWTHKAMGINNDVDFEAYLRRLWFFPFSWFITIGPVIAWLLIKHIPKGIRKIRINVFPDLWIVPLLGFLMVMLYNSIAGNLLLHHRFTATLVVLSLPWIASIMKETKRKTITLTLVSLVLTIGLSFVYPIGGVGPVPRLKNQEIKQLAEIISAESSSTGKLIIDFTGWADTWYIGLHSGFQPSNVLMYGGEKQSAFSSEEITEMIRTSDNIVFVVKDGSALSRFLSDNPDISDEITELIRQREISVLRKGRK